MTSIRYESDAPVCRPSPRCSERVVRGGPRFPARFGSRVRVPYELTSGPQWPLNDHSMATNGHL